MKVKRRPLILLFLFPVAVVTVAVSHSQPPDSKEGMPKYEVAKIRRVEKSNLSTYPATGYKFDTPSGWSYQDNRKVFMKAKIAKTSVGPANLQIKFLTTPANAYAASKKGELLRQSKQATRRQMQSPGFKAIRILDRSYKNYPAYEAEYVAVGGKQPILHRVMSFDNGKGLFLLHGIITPAPASPSDSSRAEFDRAWEQLLKTLVPETKEI